MTRKPDLNVRYVVEIDPVGFYDQHQPVRRRTARKCARQYRRVLDRQIRSVFALGEYSKGVRVYMVDADTGERIR